MSPIRPHVRVLDASNQAPDAHSRVALPNSLFNVALSKCLRRLIGRHLSTVLHFFVSSWSLPCCDFHRRFST